MSQRRGRLSAFRRWTGTDEALAAEVDLALEALRSRRDRRATTSAIAAVIARGVGLAGSFVAIPLAIGYLGVERYGIFVAVTSLTAVLIFADLGLGNGLLNVVSDAHGRNDRVNSERAVSSAFYMLVAVAAAAALAFIVAFPFIDWARLFGAAGTSAASEVGAAAAVVIGLFVIGLPLGIIERLRMAYQEGFVNSIASMVASALGLLALVIAIAVEANLPTLILVTSAPPLIALLVNGDRLFRRDRPWLRPRLRLADRRTAFRLARIGFLFLALQVAVAFAFQSDVLVAASVLGPEAAATYAVTLKFFLLTPTLVSMYLVALWPAYTEALARADIAWIRRTLRRSIAIALFASAGTSVVMLMWGSSVIRWWTQGALEPPFALLLGAAIWAVVSATFTAISILLNAASVILFQVVIASCMAVASVVLSVTFANVIGLSGIIWGTLIAYVVFSAIPILVFVPRFLRTLDDRSRAAARA